MPDALHIARGAAPTVRSRPAEDARLLGLVTDAARHVPMYRRFWAAAGIDVDSLRPAEDFQRLPRLDKSVLRNCRPEERLHDRRRGMRLIEERSSGSSGQPLTVFKDRTAEFVRRWTFLRALVACGYRPGQRCLFLTCRRKATWQAIARWSYGGINDDTEALVGRVAAMRPEVLYGPLSTLELLSARWAERTPRAAGPRLVVSTAEQLTRPRRASLERAFGARVADFYGMTEFGLIAYRAPGSPAFVPARPSLLLEYLPVPGEPEVERLVVTDLAARTSPLIRYDTGDLVRRDGQVAHRPIVEFAGRSLDCIVLRAGERVSPYRVTLELERAPGLIAFEVVQQQDLSLDVTLETELGAAAQASASVRRGLESLLGPDLPLRVVVGAIDRGPAGSKFRPVRSLAGCVA